MHNPIQVLKTEFKLPIDVRSGNDGEAETSLLVVMQQVGTWELSRKDYLANIAKLLGTPSTVDVYGEHGPKYVFGYMVQNLVKNYMSAAPEDLQVLYDRSVVQAHRYIEDNPWVFATGEDENAPPKLDAAGNPKAAKGDKKLQAKELWTKNNGIQGTVNTRKAWIELLVAECGMTTAGASTYYHNLKTGVY